MWAVPQNLQSGTPQALQPRQPYGSEGQSVHLQPSITRPGSPYLGSVTEVCPAQQLPG